MFWAFLINIHRDYNSSIIHLHFPIEIINWKKKNQEENNNYGNIFV